MIRILAVLGTRPEAIKLAPVLDELRRRSGRFAVRLCCTAQHREMLDQALEVFGLRPDVDLDAMRPGQTLIELTTRLLDRIDAVLDGERPDVVLVQGDTTTAFAAALAAFYRRIAVAHVEAGLRTYDRAHPFPEEANRRHVAALADDHFAPTPRARDNLLREGIPADRVRVTGNTVIDALLQTAGRLERDATLRSRAAERFAFLRPGARMVLITGHRRESFGAGLRSTCEGISALAGAFPDVDLIYPVHLNPNVQGPVHALLGDRANLHLVPPVDYVELVYLLGRSHFVITDSGGIQEEAPSLGKPVLVTRQATERPEALEAGAARLVGTDAAAIEAQGRLLLGDAGVYEAMSCKRNPFGDGRAAGRIADALEEWHGG